MIGSQEMNKEIYPSGFTKEDEINFDLLVAEAKRIYPKYQEWMIKIAVEAHINNEKGLRVPSTPEEVEELRNKYDLSNKKVYETPLDENVVIQPKEIIYA